MQAIFRLRKPIPFLLLSALPAAVLSGDILQTDGFSTCLDNPTIEVSQMNIQYDKSTGLVNFDVAGTSTEVQNVTASITVSAYGKEVYQQGFDPCNPMIEYLCPVPQGNFAAQGSQAIPSEYVSNIPSIAFTVPDLDGTAKLELKSAQTGQDIACIESTVSNGKTMSVPAVSYIAVGIAGAALLLSCVSSLASGGHAGSTAPSPNFGEVVGWFQGMAMNGMMSVQYPQVYQSFTKNFAFSTGVVPWAGMQNAIDSFRAKTGGNLTNDNYPFLQNATLVYTANSNGASLSKRAIDGLVLLVRDSISTNVNGSPESTGSGSFSGNTTSANTTSTNTKSMHYVTGIQAYVEQLTIPEANTFMTVLVFFAIVIAVITVGILLLKVILEGWALLASFPKSLTSFRKRYWWRLAKTITNLILLLYGVWTLYCVYQFTNGDSWAAKSLAAVTLAAFTALLGFFTFKIWGKAHNPERLYEDKETWVKYSLFYDSYKRSYWWIFVPAIVYMFAKGCVIAGANGHGLVQTVGQLIIESIMLCLLLWTRPYTLKSGNWVNMVIQVVRALSVVCILVFVEELGISQSTKTITGVVLIVVQSVLTGVLAILIAANALVACIKENPHRKKRKEAEKMNRDLDDLTPLDARNSLLIDPTLLTEYKGAGTQPQMYKAPLVSPSPFGSQNARPRYDPLANRPQSLAIPYSDDRSFESLIPRFEREDDRDQLVTSAASMGGTDRSASQSPPRRQPLLPEIEYGRAY